ncbi:MAG: helix-turn-helix domain-containing protein [Verrucomicrobia bacterium]|nr:helix-turn-helix domain-containing protein [Verrucomicrobiota bacterium]
MDYLDAEHEETMRQQAQSAFQRRLEALQPHRGLKRLRAELGASQAEMARICGVTRRTFQFYESGEKPVPSSVVCKLAATYSFDIHVLFSGRPHSDNLRVQTNTAELVSKVILLLVDKHPQMTISEMQRVAMEFARTHRNTRDVSYPELIDSIRVATGDEYVKDEVPYSAVGEWEPDDFPLDDT